jgi:hypothetical protein
VISGEQSLTLRSPLESLFTVLCFGLSFGIRNLLHITLRYRSGQNLSFQVAVRVWLCNTSLGSYAIWLRVGRSSYVFLNYAVSRAKERTRELRVVSMRLRSQLNTCTSRYLEACCRTLAYRQANGRMPHCSAPPHPRAPPHRLDRQNNGDRLKVHMS